MLFLLNIFLTVWASLPKHHTSYLLQAIGISETDGETIFLDRLGLPASLEVEVFAEVPFARSLSISPTGEVTYVGSLNFGGDPKNATSTIWVLNNKNGSTDPMKIETHVRGSNGVAAYQGGVFVCGFEEIAYFSNLENHVLHGDPIDKQIVVPAGTVIPDDGFAHGWRYCMVNDSTLFVTIGSPCNVPSETDPSKCLDKPLGSIMAFDIEQDFQMNLVVHGIRNSVGLAMHPEHNDLWFTDNGRDFMQDYEHLPPDELNMIQASVVAHELNQNNTHAATALPHYGFPYCYGKNISDAEWPAPEGTRCDNSSQYVPAIAENPSHGAALGLEWVEGGLLDDVVQESTKNSNQLPLITALHGSWNAPTDPKGYQVLWQTFNDQWELTNSGVFLDFRSHTECTKPSGEECPGNSVCQYGGFYQEPYQCTGWGRPVDVAQLPDGSTLISDDLNGVVYRVSAGTHHTGTPLWVFFLVGVLVLSAIAGVVVVFCRRRSGNSNSLLGGDYETLDV